MLNMSEPLRVAELRVCAADMVRTLIESHNSGHSTFEQRELIRRWAELTGNMVEVIDGKLSILHVGHESFC